MPYVIKNDGADVKGEGQVHFVAHGNHDGNMADWSRSGGSVRIPAGNYDVHMTFMDGSPAKDMWLDNQSFSGKVQKTVEVGVSVAEVSPMAAPTRRTMVTCTIIRTAITTAMWWTGPEAQ